MSDPDPVDEAARDLVDDYVRTVRRQLRGPGSGAVADELRDHIYEAIQASTAEPGITHVGAARRIISEFGHPSHIAWAFKQGLAARRAPSVALRALTAGAVISAVWLLVLLTGPHAPWSEQAEPAWLAISDLLGSISMAVALVAGIGALAVGLLTRAGGGRITSSVAAAEFATRLSRLGTRALGVSIAGILAYVVARGYLAPRSLEWSDVGIAVVVTGLAVLGLVLVHVSDPEPVS